MSSLMQKIYVWTCIKEGHKDNHKQTTVVKTKSELTQMPSICTTQAIHIWDWTYHIMLHKQYSFSKKAIGDWIIYVADWLGMTSVYHNMPTVRLKYLLYINESMNGGNLLCTQQYATFGRGWGQRGFILRVLNCPDISRLFLVFLGII